MPTAARLTAAIAFAIIGYIIFATMVPIYGEDTVRRFLLPLCIGSGLWAGWVLCGKNAHSIASGIGTGYTAVIAQVFWILLIMSFVFMIDQAMRRRYDGPMDAVVDVFTIMYENGMRVGSSEMGMIILVGGFVGGMLAGIMGKKFPR